MLLLSFTNSYSYFLLLFLKKRREKWELFFVVISTIKIFLQEEISSWPELLIFIKALSQEHPVVSGDTLGPHKMPVQVSQRLKKDMRHLTKYARDISYWVSGQSRFCRADLIMWGMNRMFSSCRWSSMLIKFKFPSHITKERSAHRTAQNSTEGSESANSSAFF